MAKFKAPTFSERKRMLSDLPPEVREWCLFLLKEHKRGSAISRFHPCKNCKVLRRGCREDCEWFAGWREVMLACEDNQVKTRGLSLV
jgi:hypothetical protein